MTSKSSWVDKGRTRGTLGDKLKCTNLPRPYHGASHRGRRKKMKARGKTKAEGDEREKEGEGAKEDQREERPGPIQSRS